MKVREATDLNRPTKYEVIRGLFLCTLVGTTLASIMGLAIGVFVLILKFFWGLV